MVVAFLASLGSFRSYGQAVYGSIYGTVFDKSGAVVGNAKVTVRDENKNTAVTVTANERGAYIVQNLIVGVYDVSVQAPGFATADNPHVKVFVDSSAKVDVALQPGNANDSVTVFSAGPLLKTDNADVSTIVNEKYMSSLPLPNRNSTNLQFLLPGAQAFSTNTSAPQNPQGSQRIDINGLSYSNVGYQLDGTDNQEPVLGLIAYNPIVDDVSETKLSTGNVDAQFGAAATAVIVVSTKSGTNQIHGTVWDYRQSSANLARNPYTQFAASDVPNALQNQFGGNLGGSIKKDKLFYFVGYQGFRQKNGRSVVATVPTLRTKNSCTSGGDCDLSDYLQASGSTAGQAWDPATGGATKFNGDIIPSSKINPAAVTLLKMFPDPNAGSPGAIVDNFHASGTGGFNTDQFDVRVDGTHSQNLHIFSRYSFFTSEMTGKTIFGNLGGPGLGPGGFGGNHSGRIQSFAGGADYAVRSNLLTDFRFGYHRYSIANSKYDGDEPFATNVGIPGLNINPSSGGAPQFSVGGVTTFGAGLGAQTCNCPLNTTDDQYQIVNNWSETVGNHLIKVGVDLRFATALYLSSDTNRAGALTFAASNTSSASGLGGVGMATFILGNVTSFGRFVGNPSVTKNAQSSQKSAFFYAQDMWRPNTNLTINYGLRYELRFPEKVNGRGQGALLNLNTGNLQVAGYGPYGTNMGSSGSYATFAPRIGIAYQVDPKMVVRAGYGRSFDIGAFGAIFGEAATQSLPVLANQSLTGANSHSQAFVMGQIPPTVAFAAPDPGTGTIPLPNGISVLARPTTILYPTVDTWNLSIQRQILPTLAVTLAYVGNKGTHIFPGQYASYNANNLALTANGLTFNPPSASNPSVGENPDLPISKSGDIRRYPFYPKYGWTQTINYNGPDANANYNALQVTVQKELSHGLQLTGTYAWQRAFGYDTGYYAIDKNLAYGPYPFMRVQALRVFGTWELPIGKGHRVGSNAGSVLNPIIGGWELDTILRLSSGLPFTPSYQNASADHDTGPNSAPNLVGGTGTFFSMGGFDPVSHSRRYFTPVATLANQGGVSGPFQRPGLAQFGNIRNYSFVGPGEFTEDLALQKRFSIKERLSATIRIDAFNAFNNISPGNPSACVDCSVASGAGLIRGMASDVGPRQLQFAGRLSF